MQSSKEFLGMALDGRRLRWYFNLGGETAEVLMSEDIKSDGNFNSIVLERSGAHTHPRMHTKL